MSVRRSKERMAPNVTSTQAGILCEGDIIHNSTLIRPSKTKYEIRIVWRSVILLSLLHLGAVYGLYLALTSAKLLTTVFGFWLHIFGGLGITGGAHRLWAHRAYKATWPLQLTLMLLNTIAFEDSVIHWARDHRLHHKYSETDADPYNAKRGFFFSHIGWLMCRKHPDVKEKGKEIDISDLENNPVLVFQQKYYLILMPLLCLVMPTVVPVICWGETWTNAYFVAAIMRYTITLNSTWLVNSAAHLYGNKPYDRFMNPAENRLANIMTIGEGSHNYHHVFPWDYKATELDGYMLNWTTGFIDSWLKLGLAYDAKTVTKSIIQKRVERTGDGSHQLWGSGGKFQTQKDSKDTIVMKDH